MKLKLTPQASTSFSRSGWGGEKELNHPISSLPTRNKPLPPRARTSGTSTVFVYLPKNGQVRQLKPPAYHIHLTVFEADEEASRELWKHQNEWL